MRINILFFLLVVAAGSLACRDAGARDGNKLPDGIRTYLQKEFPDWKVVTLKDLWPRHEQLYLKQHPKESPGFTFGEYRRIGTTTFAVIIISKFKGDEGLRSAKLIIFDSDREKYEANILLESSRIATPPVVFTMPPGRYLDYLREKEVTTERPVIFYVHYESSAALFHWSTGKWNELWVSE